jgi:hypothetical protein
MHPAGFAAAVRMAHVEVAKGAKRVKELGAKGTMHPIVEGVVTVVDAVATDRQEVLTVNTRDPDTGFWFSVPFTVGRDGVLSRLTDLMAGVDVSDCIDELRRILEG